MMKRISRHFLFLLSVIQCGGLMVAVSADDHGDSISTATPVLMGSISPGRIDVSEDKDSFRFSVTRPATYVFYTRGETDTYGYVYDTTGKELSRDSSSGEDENFRIVQDLSVGTYYVMVGWSGWSFGTGAKPYQLHIEGPGAGTLSDDHGFSPWSATPVAVGAIAAGQIDTEGDLDYFLLTVSNPGAYAFYTRGGTDTYGYLYDAAWNEITSDSSSGEDENFRIVQDLNVGTYYVRVSGSGWSLGTGAKPYQLHIEGPGAGTLSDDHGFSPWSATPVAVGAIAAGQIDTEGDLDYFLLTVSNPGAYAFYTRGGTDTYGYLYDAAWNEITSDSSSGEDENFRIVQDLNVGTYYVRVSGSGWSLGTGAKPYQLHIEGPGAGTLSDDHGFSPWSATPVAVGAIAAGQIDTEGDLDYFLLTVSNPGAYAFYTRGGTDTYGYLYDAAWNEITSDSSSGEDENFRIVQDLNVGTYYVRVSGSGWSLGTGAKPYQLHIEGPGAGTLSDDHGFSPWSATKVEPGSITAGQIDVEGDYDYFKVTITSPGSYLFYTRGASDVEGWLIDAEWSTITQDSSSGEDDNFRIVRTLSPGTYYVAVGFGGWSFGALPKPYELHIEGSGAATISDDHGYSPWSATKVEPGSITAGQIDVEGDYDYFKVTITSPGSYLFYTRGASDVEGWLIDAEWSTITQDSSSGEDDNFRIVRTLSPGTYYVAAGFGGWSFGALPKPYELHIEGRGAGTVSDDHGFSPWSATTVAVTSITAGQIDADGDLDYFRLVASSTGSYAFYTRGGTDTYGYLYDAGFNEITRDSSSGEGDNFRISRTLNPGTYYLRVSWEGWSFGVLPKPYELHVEGPPSSQPAPTITGVNPNPVTGSSKQQTITIGGANFMKQPTLTLTWTGQPGYTVPDSQVTFVNSTQLQMSITTATTPDAWTVKVTNPDGQSSGQFQFQVLAPPLEPFLIFPISGYTPYNNKLITAIFDHYSGGALTHQVTTTDPDNMIEAFNGEHAEKKFGDDGDRGYMKDVQGTPVNLEGIYKFTGIGAEFLQYDGHRGIDIGVSSNTPVLAAASGVVEAVGWENDGNHTQGFGLRIILKHPNSLHTFYGHLSTVTVKVGAEVTEGDPIGLSGNTGRSDAPHLHFEVRNLAVAASIDPYGYKGSAVLWAKQPVQVPDDSCECPATYLSRCSPADDSVAQSTIADPARRRASLAGMDRIDLSLLRRFRDEVLAATAGGQSLIDKFYRHSPELLGHLVNDSQLRNLSVDAVVSIQPTLTDMAVGPGTLALSTEQINAFGTMVQKLGEVAGAELKSTIDGELSRIGPLSDLAGKTSIEARRIVLGLPLQIANPKITTSGAFEFTVLGEPTGVLRIEYSNDLDKWTVLNVPPVTALPATLRDDQSLPAKQRYYRVVVTP
ncbi:MAG: M23 family metallopeptidase [Verrucomicrobiia bacterium]